MNTFGKSPNPNQIVRSGATADRGHFYDDREGEHSSLDDPGLRHDAGESKCDHGADEKPRSAPSRV